MLDMFTDCDFLFGTYKTIRYMLQQNMNVYQYILSYEGSSDVTGLGRTRQKPDLDYFFQTETRTRLLKRNPKKPEPDYETRPNPKGFCED